MEWHERHTLYKKYRRTNNTYKGYTVPYQLRMVLDIGFADSNMAAVEETCKSSGVQVVRGRRVVWDGEEVK